MDKKNSRSQRNENQAESAATDNPQTNGLNEENNGQTRQSNTTQTSSPVAEAKKRLAEAANCIDQSNRAIPMATHDTFLDERNDVMNVINELEDQLDRHQDIRERLERELKGANEKLQTSTQRTQELEWQVVTLQTRVEGLEQLRQEVTLLEEELGGANGRIQRLNEEQGQLDKDRTRLKNELKTTNKQLEDLWAIRKERDGLRSDVKSLAAKVEELERTQRDLIDERGSLAARLQEAQVMLDEIRAERHQEQILLRAAEERTRELTRVQEEIVDRVEATRTEKKNLQAQLAHMERENARLVEQRQFYETELAAQRNTNRGAETALSSVKKAFAEVRVALMETKSRTRRRMIETWPRIGIPLRGMEDEHLPIDQNEIAEPVTITSDTSNDDNIN